MKKYLMAGLLVLVTVICSSPGRAAFPQQINYQGKLANASGVPLSGNYSIVFTIYDASSGGTNKWTETQNVTVESGLFNVLLGTVTPIGLDVFDGNDRWLGITVGADPEMAPRHKLVSVGNAFKASDSDKLGGQLPSYYLGGGASGGVTLGPLTQQATTVATAVWVKGATTGISGEGSIYGVYGQEDSDHYGFLGNLYYGAYGSGDVGVNGKYNSATARFGQLGTSMYAVFGQYNADYPYGGIGASDKGVVGYSGTNGTYGVYGQYNASNYGVLGRSGMGVYGKGTYGVSGEGTTYGVYGYGTVGVRGTNGTNKGELGTGSTGVYGKGVSYGVSGEGATYGIYGTDGTRFGYLGSVNYGAYGQYNTSNKGYMGGNGYGVSGEGTTYGVYGIGTSVAGVGVQGKGISYGLYGEVAPGGAGVYGTDGITIGYLGSGAYGAYGESSSNIKGYLGGTNYGAYGQYSGTQYGYLGDSSYGVYGRGDTGVYGTNGARTGYLGSGSYGAFGEYDSDNYGILGMSDTGVYGIGNKFGAYGMAVTSETNAYGVRGEAVASSGYSAYSIYGAAPSGSSTDKWAGYFAGKLKTTDASGTNHVYDIAELIPCSSDVGPADVVVVNPSVNRQAIKCSQESDHRAIGIISENPQLSIGDRVKANQANPGKNFNFIALAGQVPCKVSAKNGPIYPGDLLTTSDIPGHAVKATKPGTIVAKALETFDGSKGDAGQILVFVNVSWFGGTQ